jgi:eukaryotic-like serine/threonine-protein kinase
VPERYVGRTLGKFRVDGLVGSGGFAWVYKAYDPELDVPIALKILKPQYAGDEKFEQRFRREAATAARLRHPNIVKIFAVGKDGDAVYFAMDYLPQNLPDKLEAVQMLPESVLLRLGMDVASAIGFAHREGVIHRDIKTDNILFDDHGNAVVADFGIARAVSNYIQQTGTNMVVGTPQYFSPEQARGLNLDGRADIYSLGITLFKAATGVLPFTGDDWYEIARQHVEDRPPKPRSLNPNLSRGLERAILKCLEKDPADRFQTGEALAQALAPLLHDTDGAANGPHGPTPRHTMSVLRGPRVPPAELPTAPIVPAWQRQKSRRRRAVQGIVAVVVAATLLAAGYLGLSARRRAALADAASARPAASPSPSPSTGAPHGTPGHEATVPPSHLTSNPGGAIPTQTPTASAPRPLFRVSGPPGTRLSVNGVAVSSPDWQTDTLAPGRYEVAAVIPGAVGCPAAHETQVVTLTTHTPAPIRFAARPCGTLVLDARPAGAAYAFRVLGTTDEINTGHTAQVDQSITLPAGEYSVSITAHDCATYQDTVHVTGADKARRLRVRLVCGS